VQAHAGVANMVRNRDRQFIAIRHDDAIMLIST